MKIFPPLLILIMMMLFTGNVCSFGQGTPQSRKDSLNNAGSFEGPNRLRQLYLIDSMFMLDEAHFKSVASELKVVKRISTTNDTAIFYSETGKTVIINGREASRKNPVFTFNCKTFRLKKITAKKLLREFHITNPKGPFVIECYAMQ